MCERILCFTKYVMCLKEIGRCAQNMLTILGSTVNMIGETIWLPNEHTNIHFDNESDIHMSFKSYEANGYGAWFGFANHLTLNHVFHILQEVGAERTAFEYVSLSSYDDVEWVFS